MRFTSSFKIAGSLRWLDQVSVTRSSLVIVFDSPLHRDRVTERSISLTTYFKVPVARISCPWQCHQVWTTYTLSISILRRVWGLSQGVVSSKLLYELQRKGIATSIRRSEIDPVLSLHVATDFIKLPCYSDSASATLRSSIHCNEHDLLHIEIDH